MMSMFLTALIAETRMAEISMQYSETTVDSGMSAIWLVLAAAILVGLVFAGYRVYRTHTQSLNCPKSLFVELCRAHRVNRAGTKMLQSIATASALEQPASLFLGESLFDAAVTQAKETLRFKPEQIAQLSMIRRRFFEA
ncbi:hypothetical protein [Novipirellula artificiosorum]|uniref:Uncharacterized protein n=1 Tax=Novipirellula artificiosorum TaxID=2528016 RepID=A0A5C6DZG2_9BACT|nr:hypothetical protein [Novipirellula artificiosorum]TWU42833.1 hypothetical protein Poly41_11340 [Novipirellula artificiosorum]